MDSNVISLDDRRKPKTDPKEEELNILYEQYNQAEVAIHQARCIQAALIAKITLLQQPVAP